jgi:hypothetical protein
MKKILVLIMTLSLMFAFVSCDDNGSDNPIDLFNSIYNMSEPTKVSTTVVETHGIHTLNASYVYTRGQVDGKTATQYVAVYDKFETVDGGISDIITGPIVTVTESKEYVDGNGVRVNGGEWKKGDDFAASKGAVVLNITEELLPDYSYFENVFAATVSEDNTEAVFGVAIGADVELEIETNGVVVTAVTIKYTIEEDGDYPEITVEMRTEYSYDIQAITLVKGN